MLESNVNITKIGAKGMVRLPREYKNLCRAVKINKYQARKTLIDGFNFDSKKEGRRYLELKFMQHAGIISDLELQPVFLLQDKFQHHGKTYRAIKYIADFRYLKNGETIVEDVKGFETQVYKIKKKMLLKKYPDINFREIK